MTRVTKKTVLLLLAALVLLSWALRYPLVEHERFQTDSYFIHLLSNSIVDEGYAVWTFHPLSYVGYYPFSYPSGVPFILAELSILTGLSVEVCILLCNIAFSTMFCLAIFLLARQFILRPELAILATFFAVLGVRFVDTTYWDGSARGPMVVLLTMAFMAAYRSSSIGQWRLYPVAILIGATTFVVHHMAVLFVLLGAAYVLSTLELQVILPRVRLRKRQVAAMLTLCLIGAIIWVTYSISDLADASEAPRTQDSSLFSFEPMMVSTLLNVVASYTNQIGFILPFAFLASIWIFRRRDFGMGRLFLFTIIVSFVPLVDRSLYVAMIITPFVSTLGVLWIGRYYDSTRRKTAVMAIVILLMASSLSLTVWSSDRWNDEVYISGDTVEVDSQLFSDASYLRVQYPGTEFLSNSNVQGVKTAALTDNILIGSGIYLALCRDVMPEDVENNVSWVEAKFPTNLYTWYHYNNEPNVDLYLVGLFMNGVSDVSGVGGLTNAGAYFQGHQKVLIMVDNKWPDNYVNQYSVYTSALVKQLESASYVQTKQPSSPVVPLESYEVFHSKGITLYLVNLNS